MRWARLRPGTLGSWLQPWHGGPERSGQRDGSWSAGPPPLLEGRVGIGIRGEWWSVLTGPHHVAVSIKTEAEVTAEGVLDRRIIEWMGVRYNRCL